MYHARRNSNWHACWHTGCRSHGYHLYRNGWIPTCKRQTREEIHAVSIPTHITHKHNTHITYKHNTHITHKHSHHTTPTSHTNMTPTNTTPTSHKNTTHITHKHNTYITHKHNTHKHNTRITHKHNTHITHKHNTHMIHKHNNTCGVPSTSHVPEGGSGFHSSTELYLVFQCGRETGLNT